MRKKMNRTFPESVFNDLKKIYPEWNIDISKEMIFEILRKRNISERNIDIFVKYYNGSVLTSLAAEYGLTPERIRQICKRCLRCISFTINKENRIKEETPLEKACRIMKLSTRSFNALARYFGINFAEHTFRNYDVTPEQILNLYNSGKLLSARNLGMGSVREIRDGLKSLGYEIDETLYFTKENER